MLNTLLRLTTNKVFYVGSSLTFIGYISKKLATKNEDVTKNEPPNEYVSTSNFDQNDLINQPPNYIETPNIENLISLPRFQNTIFLIKLANKRPNERNFNLCINELDKLSSDLSRSITKLENLTKLRLSRPKMNPFLSDGLASYISQLLNNDLSIELAFKSMNCDNRFFKSEPPGTRQKLAKLKSKKKSISIYDDPAYFILFEFFNNFTTVDSKYDSKMFLRFNSEIKFLTLTEYVIKHRPKVNVWSYDVDNILDEMDDENFDFVLNEEPKEHETKIQSLKHKIKKDFIHRNENLILELVDKMVKLDADEFIRLGGMEFLILLYEKHKSDDNYIQIIGACLNVLSGHKKNRNLFVVSGWLKRLHEMRFNYDFKEDILSMTKELITHKILYNLTQCNKTNSILYPNMIFPLHPMYSDLVNQHRQTKKHTHVIDIIFVHGLGGSVFKTWRQDDRIQENSDLMDKISVYIDKKFKLYTHCWPADWLPGDLGEKNIRLLGVNYDSLFSLWGQELIEDVKLKSSIKQRAVNLLNDLKQVGVGDRPCVWVCHSMGGLILKQLLVNLSSLNDEGKKIFDNTKGIVFLSTPHLGSSIAKTATKFKFATNPSVELIELSMNSDYLVELNKQFMNLIQNGKNLKILSLCEGLPTHLGFNLYTQTVTQKSANLNYGEFCVADNKDHLNICKPTSQDCFVYAKIKNFLSDCLNEEISSCIKCKKISEEKFSNFFELNEGFFL